MLYGNTQYNPPSRFLDEIPTELIESKGNTSGRSSYGRQSYRHRDERAYDDPPPYRRRGERAAATDRDAHDAHRERVVDAALRAANAPQPTNSQDIGLKVGDDVAHPRSERA